MANEDEYSDNILVYIHAYSMSLPCNLLSSLQKIFLVLNQFQKRQTDYMANKN